ncbi:MAG TPA: isochorismate synthase [Candidatus Acidoferrales bacterium]|nr:isochorismate synthase [Candidatus Acidoferrales bacterium]
MVVKKDQTKTFVIQTHMADHASQASDLVSSDAILDLLTIGKRRSEQIHTEVLVSLTRPFSNRIDPIHTFAVTRQMNAIVNYWALPAERSWKLGVGEAIEITAGGPLRFRKAASELYGVMDSAIIETNNTAGPIFLGGFRFRPKQRIIQPWREFDDGLLTLPRWMIASDPTGQCTLTINVTVNERTMLEKLRKQLAVESTKIFDEHELLPSPATTSVKIKPQTDRWGKKVTRALDAITAGKLSKVTLARSLKLHSKTSISPEAVLRNLTTNYPECRTFAFCRRGRYFVGASPEELVSLNGAHVASTCLAGSAPRGESEESDMVFSSWLLNNEKERREHQVVVDWVKDRMGIFCTKLDWNHAPYVLKLGNVQHLATDFVGIRAEGCRILDFVEALHPTPAVGGKPLAPALKMITKLEGFDRGWYTGPVGWVDGNGNGEFAIAIRCALLWKNEALLYAGDGIVAGSDPDTEDRETAMKFRPLLSALGAQ